MTKYAKASVHPSELREFQDSQRARISINSQTIPLSTITSTS